MASDAGQELIVVDVEVQGAVSFDTTVIVVLATNFVDKTVLVTFNVKVEIGTVTVNESTDVTASAASEFLIAKAKRLKRIKFSFIIAL